MSRIPNITSQFERHIIETENLENMRYYIISSILRSLFWKKLIMTVK